MGAADEARILLEAIAEYLGQRAIATRRRLRELFRRGRIDYKVISSREGGATLAADAIRRE